MCSARLRPNCIRRSVSATEYVALSGVVFMVEDDKEEKATEQMFAMVGRVITRWSFVESRLCNIFIVCTGDVAASPPPDGFLDFGECSVPMSVFYSVENFRGKLALIDAALDPYVAVSKSSSDEFRGQWARLRDKARKLSLKRNKLAHYTVLPGLIDDDGTDEPRLVPPYGSPKYYREVGLLTGPNSISIKQIQDLEYAMCILEERLKEFTYSLARNEELFDKYVSRLARRIEKRGYRDPTRLKRLKLAISSLP